jgi:hypothetical protein
MRPEMLRSLIFKAWKSVPMIAADNMVYPDDALHVERDAAIRYFSGRSWRDVTWESFLSYEGDRSACLCLLSPDAYRYYLPSFMLMAIDSYVPSGPTADLAWWSLTPPDDPMQAQYWADRNAGFSKLQKKAIAGFLEYMVHVHCGKDVDGSHDLHCAAVYWEGAIERADAVSK